ncbi:hypothetical protein BpHYR1_030022 [Brachionus plicatilis]|uniref:Uncharacterized protein n=1 Tax=Brachionus plicatilis TaxID=10195 RepID=A0A3M7QEH1_BRAPC|nr:hypothetical protein BpHYR1_030022 [Brachionus plicatilis]
MKTPTRNNVYFHYNIRDKNKIFSKFSFNNKRENKFKNRNCRRKELFKSLEIQTLLIKQKRDRAQLVGYIGIAREVPRDAQSSPSKIKRIN